MHRYGAQAGRNPACKPECSRCCEEDQVGRRIIQETGQSARGPEELPGLLQTEVRPDLPQKHQGRLHGDEDPDEQHRHLLDRSPGKVVPRPHILWRSAE